ncbi:MAG: phosphoglycerate kinase [Halobacteriota archaeon]
MLDFLTIDDVEVKGKTVLLRVDINVPVDYASLRISESKRIEAVSNTVQELVNREAKVVLIAHQGRVGDYDFLPLDQHAAVLKRTFGEAFDYVDDTIGVAARTRVKELKPRDVLLLQNVRFLAEETLDRTPEEHAASILVRRLGSLADVFVNDAFSAAHRSHASMVGFTCTLPSTAGRNMERELLYDQRVFTNPERPVVYCLGGSKPDDILAVMKYALENGGVDDVLTSGVLGQLFLLAAGMDLGVETYAALHEKHYLNCLADVKELLNRFGKRIRSPLDLAYNDAGKRIEVVARNLPGTGVVADIGKETIAAYISVINNAKTVVTKGPAGMYEVPGFEVGTKRLLEAIGCSGAFSLLGGAHTLSAIRELGIDERSFSYVSLGGGALINYFSGKELPAYNALKQAALRVEGSRKSDAGHV